MGLVKELEKFQNKKRPVAAGALVIDALPRSPGPGESSIGSRTLRVQYFSNLIPTYPTPPVGLE